MLRILIFVCLWLMPAVTSYAQCQFYVNASDGDDNNPGSQIRPLRSIEKAFNSLPHNAVVCLAAGEYFRGADQDGVLLGIAAKNMSFVLNEFAGSTEVRFSEASFSVAIGTGNVSFKAGTASRLVFGVGVSNTDSIFPSLTNYMHSLEFISGSVSFEGLNVVVDASVGSTAFLHPTNPLKLPKADAVLRFGASSVIGELQYAPSNRSIVFEGSATGVFRFPVPTSFENTQITFNQDYQIVFDNLIRFQSTKTPLISSSTFSGSVVFSGGLKLSGTTATEVFLSHSGSGSIVIPSLEIAPENASSGKTSLINKGNGILELGSVSFLPDIGGVSWPISLVNTSGTMKLGSPTSQTSISGSLTNAGVVELKGNVVVISDASKFATALENTGTIKLLGFNFNLTSSGVTNSSAGSWEATTGKLILNGSSVIEGGGIFPATEVNSGTFTIGANDFAGNLSLKPQANLTLSAAGNIKVRGSISMDGGTINTSPGSSLAIDGDVRFINNSAVVLSVGGISIAGSILSESTSAQLTSSRDIAISGDLSLNSGILNVFAGTGLVVKGQTLLMNQTRFNLSTIIGTFNSNLSLQGATLDLSGSTKISVFGNVLADQSAKLILGSALVDLYGNFDLSTLDVTFANSLLTFKASAPQSIRVSPNVSIPSLTSNGTLTIDSNLTIVGSLNVTGGTVTVSSARTLTVDDIMFSSGVLAVNEGSKLRVLKNFQSNQNTSLNFGVNTQLYLAGSAQVLSESLASQNLKLEIGGTETSIVNIPGLRVLNELSVTGSNKIATFSGARNVRLGARLIIGATNHLLLRDTWLELSGSTGTVEAVVNGRYSGDGGVLFTGPPSPAIQPTLSGSGILGNTTLNLSFATSSVSLYPFDKLRLSGQLSLINGVFELNGGELDFSVENGTPSISKIISNQSVSAKITDSSGQFRINPSRTAYSLAYSGSLQQMYSVGSEFEYGPIANLTISTVDALNSPAVFGVLLLAQTEILGNLTVSSGARLRISDQGMVLPSSSGVHLVDGDIIGTGALTVSGSSIFSSPLATGTVNILKVSGQESMVTTLTNLASAVSLQLSSGELNINVSGATQPLSVSKEILHSGGTLRLNRNISVGTNLQPGNWQSTGGRVIGNVGFEVVLSPASTLNLTSNSSWILDSSNSNSNSTGGFVVFTGNGMLTAVSSIPRLKLAPVALENNDIVLTGNVFVSEQLVTQGADILLGPNTFTFSGVSWAHEIDPVFEQRIPGVIYGDFNENKGLFVVTGQTTLVLGKDLQFNLAAFAVLSGASSLVAVESSNGQPHEIILTNRPFEIGAARFNLGINDLVLLGNADPILKMAGGTIDGASILEIPSWLPVNLRGEFDRFPFNDDMHGEVIMGGLSNSSISSSRPSSITNLTGNRSFRLSDSSASLRISNRLVFGEKGAGIASDGAANITLTSGATIIRRGSGQLSFSPVFEGEVDIFYDLDDGSLSGFNSDFSEGQLLTGKELPASVETLNRLGIVAGQYGNSANRVKLAQPIHVRDLILFSGILDGNTQLITFKKDGRFSYIGSDPLAAPVFQSSVGYATPWPIQIRISSQFADFVTTDATLPRDALISELFVSMGNPSATLGRDFRLHSSRNVGSLNIDHRHASSRFRLNGSTLSVAGNAIIGLGTLSSDPISGLVVAGNFDLKTNARVSGNVETIVSGDVVIEGSFLSQSLHFGKNLTIQGTVTPLIALEAIGSRQEIFMRSGGQTISSLTLNMTSASSAEVPLLTISNAQGVQNLNIQSRIRFLNGVLVTGSNSLVLPPNGSAILHEPQTNMLSHILGNVSYDVPERFIGDLVFPVGGALRYNPLQLHLSEQVISPTRLNVQYEDSTPFGKIGLPLQTSGTSVIQDTVPFSWLLTSSVNFGSSQIFAFTAHQPDTSHAALKDLAFLRRESTSYTAPWSLPTGVDLRGNSNGASYLRHNGNVGGLDPSGTIITLGTPLFLGAKSMIQVVDLFSSPSRIPVDIYFNDRLVFPNWASGQSTAVLPIDVSLYRPSNNRVTITPVGGNPNVNILGTSSVSNQGGQRTLLAIHPGPDGELLFTSADPVFNDPPVPNSTGVIVFNGTHGFDELNLTTFPASSTIATGLLPGRYSSTVVVPPSKNIFRVSTKNQPNAFEAYSFDFTREQGQIVVLLVQGTSLLNVAAVLENGTFVQGARATLAEVDDVLPTHFSLGNNFPNPFDRATNISVNMATQGNVEVTIYDPLGRTIKVLNVGVLAAGPSQLVEIDGAGMAAGTYFYVVQISSSSETHHLRGKLVLVR